MVRELKLEQLYTFLEEVEYPHSVQTAAEAFDDVTLLLADGTVNLGEVVADSSSDEFESADDLALEVMSLLPRRAVGEPFQSEGEG
ncbi:hypothetical protein [Salinibaculum salinum]|uniref:DUF5789 family protein n=1 Tax=Salinibaculum salinum TaxID=3131996 RepID=UPI0030EC9373